MNPLTTHPRPSRRARGAAPPARSSARRAAHRPVTEPDGGADPHHRGGRVLFDVPFTSVMGDAQLSLLASMLDLWTHMEPKMRPDPNSPGVARLDDFSGLFLERAAGDERWRLRARTWGDPAPQIVHRWHLVAAQAARRLDPEVALPAPIVGGRS